MASCFSHIIRAFFTAYVCLINTQMMLKISALLSLWHALWRTFSSEESATKSGISLGQCFACLDLLEKNGIRYFGGDIRTVRDLYEQFAQSAPPTVVAFYNTNWHSIGGKWRPLITNCDICRPCQNVLVRIYHFFRWRSSTSLLFHGRRAPDTSVGCRHWPPGVACCCRGTCLHCSA